MIPRIKPPQAQEEIKKTLLAKEVLIANARTKFESALATFIGSHYVVALNRGRDALTLVLKALELPPYSSIALPAVCCPAILDATLAANLTPVWTDVNMDGNISPGGLKQSIKKGAKAVIVAHLYGMPAPMSSLIDICEENNIILIEDCAQALGVEYAHRQVGTFGKASIFSFAFDKHLSLGLGGALATNDVQLALSVQKMALPPFSAKREKEFIGGLALLEHQFKPSNYHQFLPVDKYISNSLKPQDQEAIDKWLKGGILAPEEPPLNKKDTVIKRLLNVKKAKPVQEVPRLMGDHRAFLGIQLLKHMPKQNWQRRFLAAKWRDGLAGLRHFSRYAWDPDWFQPIPPRYNLLVDPAFRSQLIKLVCDMEMECGCFNWPTPLAPLPNAQDFFRRILNLPNFPELDQDAIIDITKKLHEVWQ